MFLLINIYIKEKIDHCRQSSDFKKKNKKKQSIYDTYSYPVIGNLLTEYILMFYFFILVDLGKTISLDIYIILVRTDKYKYRITI